jgi:hypothetical protein
MGPHVWNVTAHCVLFPLILWSFSSFPECQMSKRKPTTASKHSPGSKTAKAQRSAQPVVRSPKDSDMPLVAARQAESPPKAHFDSKQVAPLVENPVTTLEADRKIQMMTDDAAKKGFDLSAATANVRAYQAKLQEIAQADMRFAFEFAQRLAAIRSPIEFPHLIAEFTSKRIAMFIGHSREIAELSTGRRAA